jgi:hypothetical protein
MWGKAVTPGVRAWVAGGPSNLVYASAIAIAGAPVTAAAAAQLCPCPAIPDVPWSPLLVIVGVGVTAGLGVRRRRTRTDDSRRSVARAVVRIVTVALAVAFMVFVSLVYNASATELCPCGGGGGGGDSSGGGYHGGVSGLTGPGVPSVGVSTITQPGLLIIFGGAVLVSGATTLRRRRPAR